MTLYVGMNTPMQREAELNILETQSTIIEGIKKEISLVLNDIIASLLKQGYAPCSSDMHLYSAVQRLRRLAPDWNAWDKESNELCESIHKIMQSTYIGEEK